MEDYSDPIYYGSEYEPPNEPQTCQTIGAVGQIILLGLLAICVLSVVVFMGSK